MKHDHHLTKVLPSSEASAQYRQHEGKHARDVQSSPARSTLTREKENGSLVIMMREPPLHEHILVVRTPHTMPTAARRRQHITIQPESHAAAAPKFSRLASAAKAKAFLSAEVRTTNLGSCSCRPNPRRNATSTKADTKCRQRAGTPPLAGRPRLRRTSPGAREDTPRGAQRAVLLAREVVAGIQMPGVGRRVEPQALRPADAEQEVLVRIEVHSSRVPAAAEVCEDAIGHEAAEAGPVHALWARRRALDLLRELRQLFSQWHLPKIKRLLRAAVLMGIQLVQKSTERKLQL
eukprot:CAMPEP_0183475730 /NCGR_PEP_ID=MMETSP0370-20130417/165281_1 /TAXON_ID=268820 /ORGANISM="Peridinium aciculiferum, Strain PAER-2" /LENGTH=291 /DNA_ID=CAMNT_0025668541 /DNA_START=10 /DNA_END=883 /DNA_ORIENTATION=-